MAQARKTAKRAAQTKKIAQRVAQAKRKAKRDVEKDYPPKQFVAKLRRLADCIEQGKQFRIQIAGERVAIPPTGTINIEHERGKSEEEIEFQIKWPLKK